MQHGRAARSAWLDSASRSTPAFTVPYKPAPLTFRGQLWAALSRSTPAFTGARAPIGITSNGQRGTSIIDIAKREIIIPTFLNRDRADAFACDRGRVLALTLARDREFGLHLARDFALNCADFLAGVFGSDNPYSFSELVTSNYEEYFEFVGFHRQVERSHTLALALGRMLARDLSRSSAYNRSLERRRIHADIRNRARRLFRPDINGHGVHGFPMSFEMAENFFRIADAFYRSRPVTVTSSRARDISLELAASFDRLRISYGLANELTRGLHQNLAGTDLRHADLHSAQLAQASLRGSNLYNAHLSAANLSGADLSGSHLIGTDLRKADLSGASLIQADLSNANLKGADLSRADLSRAEPRGVVWSKSTIWPAAFEREMWARSREIEPGVFQVDEGGERSPLKEFTPAHY